MGKRRNPYLFGQPMRTALGCHWIRMYGDVCARITWHNAGLGERDWEYSFGAGAGWASSRAEAERKLESLIRKTWRSLYAAFRRARRG